MPYTPTERNRVGEFLMQGIAGAGQNIGAAIDRYKTESQKANTLRKAISLYDETMKDQVQTMGLRDLEGFIQGQGMKQAKTALENQARLQAAQIKNFEADNQRADTALRLQQDTAAQQKAQLDALAAFARDYGAPAIPGVSSAAMLDAAQLPPGERLRQALGRNPGALTPQMLQTLVRYGDEAGGKPDKRLIETTLGGRKFALSPDTGAFQALPTDELTPAEKQRYIAGLYGQRRQLLASKASTLDDAVKPQIDEELARLDDELQAMGARPAPAKPAAAAPAGAEVVRMTKDGRKAVFNAETKQFLRYAN
jgi:hypothetical protein